MPLVENNFYYNFQIFPVFYVLMTHKSQAAYEHLFKYISDNWNLHPTKFMCDFERGLRNAIRKTYPGIPVKGCWFHYCQAIRKRAAKIPGFFQEIWASEAKKQFFHKLLSLALLKEGHILNAFRILKTENLNFENPLQQFLIYFERQWMRREGPSNISVYFELNRTNNLSESYNSYLKTIIRPHGSFFDFITVLLKEEKRIARDFRVQSRGGDRVFVARRKKYATRDAHIKAVQQRFEEELIDVAMFLNQITFSDNTGAIREMDTYDDGDENDTDEDDDVVDDDTDQEPEEGAEGAVGGLAAGVLDTSRYESVIVSLQTQVDRLRAASLCIVCLSNERNTMILLCGHVRTCQECTDVLRTVRYDDEGIRIPPTCPLCRGAIVGAERAYL